MELSKEQIVNSLRSFKTRRDCLLHEDAATFDHHYDRFVQFCRTDPLVQSVLSPLLHRSAVDLDQWWTAASMYSAPKLEFPPEPSEELALRFRVIESANESSDRLVQFGCAHHITKVQDIVELFRSLIIRPFADDLTYELGQAADLATPDARMVQAVPLSRIPSPKEARIFLSHKSVDKPSVYRYYNALAALGFDPWLDEPSMPVGSNLERELRRGFRESCAAVFFLTANFTDERYLASEIDYAIIEKREKGKKFAIITLRFSASVPLPELLTPYTYKDVNNDLDAFYAIIKALPVELGPVRWKAHVI